MGQSIIKTVYNGFDHLAIKDDFRMNGHVVERLRLPNEYDEISPWYRPIPNVASHFRYKETTVSVKGIDKKFLVKTDDHQLRQAYYTLFLYEQKANKVYVADIPYCTIIGKNPNHIPENLLDFRLAYRGKLTIEYKQGRVDATQLPEEVLKYGNSGDFEDRAWFYEKYLNTLHTIESLEELVSDKNPSVCKCGYVNEYILGNNNYVCSGCKKLEGLGIG